LKKWQDLYNLYTDQLIPQSQMAFETSLARYNTGRAEFMSMIDTQRILLRYRKEALMARKEYLSGMAKLNELMGIEDEK
jgi:outer membrane protein TolC